MSIKAHLESAIFLAENEQYLTAFTLTMVAIAASARKRFPETVVTRRGKTEYKTKDKEAFMLFLGGRLRADGLIMQEHESDIGPSGTILSSHGNSFTLEQLIYEQHRCTLIHEGSTPPTAFIRSHNDDYAGDPRSSYGFSYPNGVLTLDYGWIYKLADLIAGAPINGREFGISHFVLDLKENHSSADYEASINGKFGDTALASILVKRILKKLTTNIAEKMTDELLIDAVLVMQREEYLNGGMSNLLKMDRAIDNQGRLTKAGVALIRETCIYYETKDFAR